MFDITSSKLLILAIVALIVVMLVTGFFPRLLLQLIESASIWS